MVRRFMQHFLQEVDLYRNKKNYRALYERPNFIGIGTHQFVYLKKKCAKKLCYELIFFGKSIRRLKFHYRNEIFQ